MVVSAPDQRGRAPYVEQQGAAAQARHLTGAQATHEGARKSIRKLPCEEQEGGEIEEEVGGD